MNFDKDQIILFAKISNLSYFTREELNKIYNTRPCKKEDSYIYKIIKNPNFFSTYNDCQYIIIELEKSIVIAYRGTSSRTDIYTDLKFFREKIILKNYIEYRNQPYVHSGFFQQFNSSRGDITFKLKKYIPENKNKSMVFTGHSLGGALATIASLYYSYEFWNYPTSCITFGSPRVGCPSFANIFNKKITTSFRFVNDNDPVPCIPSTWHFKHVNGCKWLNQDKIESEIKVYRGWRFVKNTFLNIFGYGYNAMKDHSCEEYIKDLEIIL